MSGLSKLGIALSIVFAFSLVALVAELFYVLWRRRVFRRNNFPVHGGDHGSDSFSTNPSNSKELLYFFCWKSQSRVEPDGAPTRGGSDGYSPDDPAEIVDILKLQGLYGPSRVLFTIKEEEREDVESEKSLSSTEKGHNKTKSILFEECLRSAGGESPEVAVRIDDVGEEMTPFSTPCASPLYYTPAASPSREVESGAGNLTHSPGN
ncbi:uncharacterized protein LOC132293231 [Cornus florida]|uniref:uncharacterized protein LOC132293231 n=1 Tax=Cornus florida TaxID=4283 RepID=UPI00289A05B1|nr:uncharacterized protein LOC132293231 [Cornus florida]